MVWRCDSLLVEHTESSTIDRKDRKITSDVALRPLVKTIGGEMY